MQAHFVDRTLVCADCHQEFIFTAGEQLFFADRQFKNDPRRCKPCKTRRAGLAAVANGTTPPHHPPRTETRTQCSECGVETTVPFKPTQGRPVLCRQCFQLRSRTAQQPAIAAEPDAVAQALTTLSETSTNILSPEAAVVAAVSVSAASPASSVATQADLATLAPSMLFPSESRLAMLPPLVPDSFSDQPDA